MELNAPVRSLKALRHPMGFGSLQSWLRLWWETRGVEPAYWPRAAFITLGSLMTAPLHALEKVAYFRTLQRTEITQPPVFIIGHWRSGTTHLHNLLVQDERFGYVSMFQTMSPEGFLLGQSSLKPLISAILPATRPFDDVPLSVDLPQEEEVGLMLVSPYSYYHYMVFPRQTPRLFEKYATFKTASPKIVDSWSKAYLRLLKKATYVHGGKPLMLKNPVNTVRIPLLLKLFPDARFIYMHRDPYTTFVSTRHMAEKALAMLQLQDIPMEMLERNILHIYAEMTRKYLADKALIPKGNLLEVSFEMLEDNALATLKTMYRQFSLPDYQTAAPAFQAYQAGQADYRKNQHVLSHQDIDLVDSHCQFIFEKFGYDYA